VDEVKVAEALARLMHAGQVDKAGEPYIEHLSRVAQRVPEKHRAAAWLHDIIEDTPLTFEELGNFGFSRNTIDAVVILTRRQGETYSEFIERVLTKHYGDAAITAKVVKLEDVRDHLRDITPLSDSMVERYAKALYELTR
jgi:(p)ppGpp synthase/HD superfamily hydrolase